MKKTLAMILSLSLALGAVAMLASCGKEPVDTPETTVTAVEDVTAEALNDVTAEATEAATEAASEAASEVATEAAATDSTEAATEAAAAPATTEEILKVYNDAINNVISTKAGYSKIRTTNINNIEGGALLNIGIVQDAIGDFLGEGTKDYTNTKGKAEYMSKASLSAADVKSATCKENGGKYTIEITLNDGKSSASASGVSDSSPLKRTGLLVGDDDSSKFDYKSSQNIYVALNGTGESSVESGTGKTYNGKITAVVDAASGQIESMSISFNFSVALTNTKYSIITIKDATGDATTTVKYSSFKY